MYQVAMELGSTFIYSCQLNLERIIFGLKSDLSQQICTVCYGKTYFLIHYMLKEEASRGDSKEKFLGNTVLSQNGDNCAFVRHRVNPLCTTHLLLLRCSSAVCLQLQCQPQFYIQLVYEAILSFTLRIQIVSTEKEIQSRKFSAMISKNKRGCRE